MIFDQKHGFVLYFDSESCIFLVLIAGEAAIAADLITASLFVTSLLRHRVITPKGTKTIIFKYVFLRFWGPGPGLGPSPGLGVEFPVKICDLDAYLRDIAVFVVFAG